MEVEGNTAANVQDASFLKKDAVVDEKLNNAVETTTAKIAESVGNKNETEIECIKKSEADCSSTVVTESCSLDKIVDEKDDLLEQIEEVCNDKVSGLKNSEDISKTSEHEFLKKIEEMERGSEIEEKKVDDEKANNVVEELKAKNILECETSTVDAVVVGDKILEVKDDDSNEECNQSVSATSSADVKEHVPPVAPVDVVELEKECDSVTDIEMPNKDALVSSSTNKIDVDQPAGQIEAKKDSEPMVEEVESTGTHNISEMEEDKTTEPMETKTSDVEERIGETMDVDAIADAEAGIIPEVMDVDVKDSSPENNVEMISENTDNEAKSKMDTVEASDIVEINDVDMKETTTSSNNSATTTTDATTTSTTKSVEVQPTPVSPAATKLDEKNAMVTKEEKPEIVLNHIGENEQKKGETASTVETTNTESKSSLSASPKENDVVSSSLINTTVSTSNVLKSALVQKQPETPQVIASNTSDTTSLNEVKKDKPKEATSTKPQTRNADHSLPQSEAIASSVVDKPTSDGAVNKFVETVKKYNGMPDTTTDEEDTTTPSETVDGKKDKTLGLKLSQLSGTDIKKDSHYQVVVRCESNDVYYLSVERVDPSSISNSVQSSSNGSLPPQPTETSTTLESTTSSNCHKLTDAPANKQIIVGIEELCNFMINEFTKIKHAINPESAKAIVAPVAEAEAPTTPANTVSASSSTPIETLSTPLQHTRKNKNRNSPAAAASAAAVAESPSTSASKSKRSRKRSLHEDDSDSTPKAKQAKRDTSKETPKADESQDGDESKAGPCVLAKWVDKKFYAGKITGEKPGNKYVVLFEDGASKILPKESIVFGEGDTLPLQDQQVYALVEEDYECGVVLSIEKTTNKVLYTVKTDNTTVKVTASDIYLEVDQAKDIQKLQNTKVGEVVEEIEDTTGTRPSRNKRLPISPSTPEAGFSGSVGKRSTKRQKRPPPFCLATKSLSESSDSTESPPASPKETVGLELVEGVQPELQNSPNDSELSRMIFVSDYKKSDPNCDVDEMLGPLPKLKTLFRNKHFLLTCTVGLKPHQFMQDKANKNEDSRFKQFSAVPYVKHYLQRQLEAGGANIYKYFEDVPKNKYKQCKLIAPRPCITAKYVQCLSSDIPAVSHEWIIDSCRQNKLCDYNKYLLPAGWSILTDCFVKWKIGKHNNLRLNSQPFTKSYVLIAGQHSDFVELWGRVCKAAGAKLRLIKSMDDITPTTTGFMVAESDFSHAIKAKAQHYGIPVVSTVWVVQSLIMGMICPPESHPRLLQTFEDEEV